MEELQMQGPNLTEMEVRQVYNAVRDLITCLKERTIKSDIPKTPHETVVLRDGVRSLLIIENAFVREYEEVHVCERKEYKDER